ncbi:MAG: metal ABC transporter permease, partial [Planctomycetes bacterium]|nr:metal ABC transporter permease [Planctomycetota bacterium]
LMSYLFGSILGISYVDLQIIFALDVIIFVVIFMFYRQFHVISFDEEYAKSLGIRVQLFNSVFMVLVAFTVVVLIQVVGIILVIALITIPPAIAGRFVKSLKQMMVVASIIALIVTVGGIWIAFELEALTSKQIPPSAMIILLASTIYLLVSFFRLKRRKFKEIEG